MMIRRSALETTRGFDEDFFLYGEDLDLCHRARTSGWKVFYTPATQIVHFKGQSARKTPLRSRFAFYNAMFLFSRKHIAARHSFLPRWILYGGIALNATAGILRLPGRHLPAAFLDLAVLNLFLSAFIVLWFRHIGMIPPYFSPDANIIGVHLIFTFVWLSCLGVGGAYGFRRHWAGRAFRAGLVSTVLSLSTVYLFNQFAFSRAAFVMTAICSLAALPGWRRLADRAGAKGLLVPDHHILVVGDGPQVALALRSISRPARLRLSYMSLRQNASVTEAEFLGAPSEIHTILRSRRIDELIFFENALPYTQIVEIIAANYKSKPLIRLASKTPDGKLLVAELGHSLEPL
jgi:hypothetical protein